MVLQKEVKEGKRDSAWDALMTNEKACGFHDDIFGWRHWHTHFYYGS